MRNNSKITTLEAKFPLLSIEQGCMVSKDADITVAFRVELPELFTVTSAEYEAMHSAWHKAIKVLPNYTIVHKQDWFIKENYQAKMNSQQGSGLSFLAKSSERHFNERPYLHHSVYLFLTKTNKQRMQRQSNFSSLCRGHLLPKEITDKEEVIKFMEAVDQFERIINDTEQIRLTRMTEEDLVGTAEQGGLLDRYFSLSEDGHASLEDIRLGSDLVRVGDNRLCLHTLSDTDDLPTSVSTDTRYERLSTDRSDCRLSFAAPASLMLPCNHIYNQYLFIEDSDDNLQRFEKQARNMHSLARYSRSNQINEEWIQEYLNVAHSQGLTSIRAHFNVLAWSDDKEELRNIKNDVGSALALMECKPRHNTIDTATLYWAGIPGNAADFPSEESFYTFIEPALCFFTAETNYKDSLSPFGIKMADRLSGKPIHLDISDLPMKKVSSPTAISSSWVLLAVASLSSLTTWYASITSKERMCSWSIRVTAIKACASLSTARPKARTGSILPIPMSILSLLILSSPMITSLMWRKGKVSAPCCLRYGRVPMNILPRQKQANLALPSMPTSNLSGRITPSFPASTPSMSTCVMCIVRIWSIGTLR